MSSHPRHENAVVHGPASNQQPLVDGWTASDSASNTEDLQQNSTTHRSLVPAAGNIVASNVELHPQANPDSLADGHTDTGTSHPHSEFGTKYGSHERCRLKTTS